MGYFKGKINWIKIKICLNMIIRNSKSTSIINEKSNNWIGRYNSWEEANILSQGYDNDTILNKCVNSLLAIRNGEAIYERDSVLFDKKQYSTGVLSALFLAALNCENKLSVLDFGGSLGSSYYQNQDFFYLFKDFKWGIVEQENFCRAGNKFFANHQLSFFENIDVCINEISPNIILISSSLQYVSDPESILKQINNSNVKFLVLDRISFSNCENFVSVQKVPSEIYDASYPSWIFNEEWLIKMLYNYKVLYDFQSYCDSNYQLDDNFLIKFQGFVFELKN